MMSPHLDSLSDEQLLAWFTGVLARAQADFPGSPVTHPYGEDPFQVVDIWGDPQAPVWVVSIHGGYFAAEYDRTVNEPLARYLASAGMAVANIEYRRTGSAPNPRATVQDVREAIAAVLDWAPRESTIVVVGHSAGGYLALTGATHENIRAVIPLAPVTDLLATAAGGWDDGAIAQWIGTTPPGDVEIWRSLQPEEMGMATTDITILHGGLDAVVPIHLGRDFESRHPHVGFIEIEDAGHYEFLDPQSEASRKMLSTIRHVTLADDDRTAPPTHG